MNLVFLSGPQGAGKTTLINLLAGPEIISPELETKTLKFDIDPKKRIALKICQRSLENFEYLQIARQNPEKVILGNRCIYDQYAFNEVFVKRGWIKEEEKERYDENSRLFYLPELHAPRAIVLNPDFNIVTQHLEKRWQTEGVKWREQDSEYIWLACEAYKSFRDREEILYIDHRIDLKDKTEKDRITDWILQVKKKVFCHYNY